MLWGAGSIKKTEKAILPDGTIYVMESTWVHDTVTKHLSNKQSQTLKDKTLIYMSVDEHFQEEGSADKNGYYFLYVSIKIYQSDFHHI